MGRKVRRVPPGWDHPKNDRGTFIPMHDETYAEAVRKWLSKFDNVRVGIMPKYEEHYLKATPEETLAGWLDDHSPPDSSRYRPEFSEEPTWFQLYETVSEGTPSSPAFSTPEELVEYLVSHGDYGQQEFISQGWSVGPRGWTRAQAEKMVRDGWAPTAYVLGA